MNSDADIGRLRWRCRRGMRELDQLLLRYVDTRWPAASDSERKLFLQLLECEDDKLWQWCMGRAVPPETGLAQIVEQMVQLPP